MLLAAVSLVPVPVSPELLPQEMSTRAEKRKENEKSSFFIQIV
jgi:hypothetical protein